MEEEGYDQENYGHDEDCQQNCNDNGFHAVLLDSVYHGITLTLEVTERTMAEEVNPMKDLAKWLRNLWVQVGGQDLTEYALLLVLIALVAIASVNALGVAVSKVFMNAAQNLSGAPGTP
jgi:Flp pilus assembly pilin Flp